MIVERMKKRKMRKLIKDESMKLEGKKNVFQGKVKCWKILGENSQKKQNLVAVRRKEPLSNSPNRRKIPKECTDSSITRTQEISPLILSSVVHLPMPSTEILEENDINLRGYDLILGASSDNPLMILNEQNTSKTFSPEKKEDPTTSAETNLSMERHVVEILAGTEIPSLIYKVPLTLQEEEVLSDGVNKVDKNELAKETEAKQLSKDLDPVSDQNLTSKMKNLKENNVPAESKKGNQQNKTQENSDTNQSFEVFLRITDSDSFRTGDKDKDNDKKLEKPRQENGIVSDSKKDEANYASQVENGETNMPFLKAHNKYDKRKRTNKANDHTKNGIKLSHDKITQNETKIEISRKKSNNKSQEQPKKKVKSQRDPGNTPNVFDNPLAAMMFGMAHLATGANSNMEFFKM
ncbi:uncharacterized protein LOC136039852 isoform X2 [Artemia franciscana]